MGFQRRHDWRRLARNRRTIGDLGSPDEDGAKWQLPHELVAGAPPAVTGTAASSFSFSTEAQGVEIFTGTAASSFSFSSSASGELVFTGAGGSVFVMTTELAGEQVFTGSAAVTFLFATAAQGELEIEGAAASTFTFASSSSGEEIFEGAGGSVFGFSSSASGDVVNPGPVDITGTSDVTFVFSSSSSGAVLNPEPPDFGKRTFRVRADPAPRLRVWGEISSTFTWGSRARGVVIPPIVGVSASTFSASIAAEGEVDDRDLLVHLEDERLLLGVGELELV